MEHLPARVELLLGVLLAEASDCRADGRARPAPSLSSVRAQLAPSARRAPGMLAGAQLHRAVKSLRASYLLAAHELLCLARRRSPAPYRTRSFRRLVLMPVPT
ncbi:uncharacterized protein LOC100194171 [Zea mays]|jgi:hypothetical protein|uniref:Secreted protein n=1 Tax=Zea mays TaxID=4577 RepID=B4FHP6_MAIZE|nr:uncharacterized protein LOC100194171 [Zea mays]ACF81639.1 unknown [Zea mays]|eukprot:NP_001132693.1 uncharacterized protein LOC100194171 [Zea mays]